MLKVRLVVVLLAVVILAGCSSLSKKSQNFYFGSYSEAEEFYAKGEYKNAIDKYEEYRLQNPEGNMSIMAKYYTAKSYQELGNVEKAKQFYTEVATEHPDVVWAGFSKTQLEALSKA